MSNLIVLPTPMTPASYQHAIDSGVYLKGVDASDIGARVPVERGEIGDPPVFLIIGQSNGANDRRTARARILSRPTKEAASSSWIQALSSWMRALAA